MLALDSDSDGETDIVRYIPEENTTPIHDSDDVPQQFFFNKLTNTTYKNTILINAWLCLLPFIIVYARRIEINNSKDVMDKILPVWQKAVLILTLVLYLLFAFTFSFAFWCKNGIPIVFFDISDLVIKIIQTLMITICTFHHDTKVENE